MRDIVAVIVSRPSSRALCEGSEREPDGVEGPGGRGGCPVCGGSYRLKLDGKLVKHRPQR
jgi:hypothetical protein